MGPSSVCLRLILVSVVDFSASVRATVRQSHELRLNFSTIQPGLENTPLRHTCTQTQTRTLSSHLISGSLFLWRRAKGEASLVTLTPFLTQPSDILLWFWTLLHLHSVSVFLPVSCVCLCVSGPFVVAHLLIIKG